MGQFEVYNRFPGGFTILSNLFLDYYMPSANGEFVKIYLYLQRHACSEKSLLDLSSIADTFNCTEADIKRALRYWEKTGLLDVSFDASGALSSVVLYPPGQKAASTEESAAAIAPAGSKQTASTPNSASAKAVSSKTLSAKTLSAKTVSTKPGLTPDKIRELKGNDEVRQLLFIAEQYLGKTLTATDMETLLYLYDELHLSADLMEYLIEYCVSKGSTSMAYIKTVGLSWAEQNITTVTQAKEETNLYNRNYFTILRAFGIKNRNPLSKEIQYMNLWLNQYGFTLDIISEACSRTVLSTGKASFSYADSILEAWFKKGVHHLSDIDSLDQNFQQKKAEQGAKTAKAAAPKPKVSAAKNKFNNFHQRNYNMAELEKQLLGK